MAFEKVEKHVLVEGEINKDFAWSILSDIKNYKNIMDNVDDIHILERDDEKGVSEWFVTVEEAPLTWKEKDKYDNKNYTFAFESFDGDFDTIRGFWKIEDYDKGGIKIISNIEYDLGIPVLEEVLGSILKEKMIVNIDIMLNSIKNKLLKN